MKYRFVEIEINDTFLCRLLNNSQRIKIKAIRHREDRCVFLVDYRDADDICRLMNRLNITILSRKNRGIYDKIFNLAFLKFSAAVCGIFILLLMINSLYIWQISVDGNYSYTDERIIKFVRNNKIREGMLKAYADCDTLEEKIREKYNDISWVCAEIKGTNLIIHIKENYITEISKSEDKPYDIVANTDAQIVSIFVRHGSGRVKAGDYVKKGDVLISGCVDVKDESDTKIFSKYYSSDGEIVGKTTYYYKDSLGEKYNEKIIEKTKKLYLPFFAKYKWSGFRNKKRRDIVYDEEKLKLFGETYLPLGIQKYTFLYYKIQEKKYTKQEAKALLGERFNNKLSVLEQKDYKIIEKNVKINRIKDSYELSGTILCEQPLGAVSYISRDTASVSDSGE